MFTYWTQKRSIHLRIQFYKLQRVIYFPTLYTIEWNTILQILQGKLFLSHWWQIKHHFCFSPIIHFKEILRLSLVYRSTHFLTWSIPLHNKALVRYLYLLSELVSGWQYPAGKTDMCGRHSLTSSLKCQCLSGAGGNVKGVGLESSRVSVRILYGVWGNVRLWIAASGVHSHTLP